MENKQTAVEWLLNQISINGFKQDIEQALQMEKEQHSKTWDSAIQAHEDRGHVLAKSWEDFEEYYAEKYGKITFIDLVSDEESKVHEVVRKLKEKRIK
jgi:trehalose-6-phosphate synthase